MVDESEDASSWLLTDILIAILLCHGGFVNSLWVTKSCE